MKWNVVVVVVHSRIVFARSTSFPLSEGRFFICEARFFIWKGFDFPRRKGGEEFSIIIIAASSSEWTGYLLKFWWFLSSETGDVILFYFYGRKLQVRREFFLCSVLDCSSLVLGWRLHSRRNEGLETGYLFFGRKLQVSQEFFHWSVLVVLLWSLVTSFVIIMIVDLIHWRFSTSLLIAFTIIKENFSAIAAATGKLLVLVLLDWEAKKQNQNKKKNCLSVRRFQVDPGAVASLAF